MGDALPYLIAGEIACNREKTLLYLPKNDTANKTLYFMELTKIPEGMVRA
jgi:hypothetical protein